MNVPESKSILPENGAGQTSPGAVSRSPFGNDPAKIERYRTFWRRADAVRPLVGFTMADWFPLHEFAACRPWQQNDYLESGMIAPDAFLEDHLRLLHEGELIDDDLIRGA